MKNLNWTVEKQQLVTTSNILTDSFAVVRTMKAFEALSLA